VNIWTVIKPTTKSLSHKIDRSVSNDSEIFFTATSDEEEFCTPRLSVQEMHQETALSDNFTKYEFSENSSTEITEKFDDTCTKYGLARDDSLNNTCVENSNKTVIDNSKCCCIIC